MTKNIPFFPILHVFAPLNDVRAYIAWSWKTTLITWIFLRGWYPTSNTSGPPGHITHCVCCIFLCLAKHMLFYINSRCKQDQGPGPWHSAPCVISSFVSLVCNTDFQTFHGGSANFMSHDGWQNLARSWILSFKLGSSGFQQLLTLFFQVVRFDCQ